MDGSQGTAEVVEVVLRDLCFALGREQVGSIAEAVSMLSGLGYRWSDFSVPGMGARLALGRRSARVYEDGVEVTATLRDEPSLDPSYRPLQEGEGGDISSEKRPRRGI